MKSPVIKHPCSSQTVGKIKIAGHYMTCKNFSIYTIITEPNSVKYFNIRNQMIMYGYYTVIMQLCQVISILMQFLKSF